MKSDKAGALWLIFFHGDLRSMAAQRCSHCGGLLQWSPYIHEQTREYRGEQKHPMGLSIYCRGTCKYMIAHLDGIAPDWALAVTDWDAFNLQLESTQIPESGPRE
jgi:hypothetical protein